MKKTYTVHFTTLGCKVNQYDSNEMMDMFRAKGFQPYNGATAHNGTYCNPDVIIVNTCIVSSESERKSRQAIRRMRAKYPNALLAAVGCYPQRNPELVSAIKGVDFIAGTTDHETLVNEIILRLGGNTQTASDDGSNAVYMSSSPMASDGCPPAIIENNALIPAGEIKQTATDRGGQKIHKRLDLRTRTYIKIQDGCDSFCSYCIVPYTRGRARSRDLPNILDEVEAKLSSGAPEIVLTGINISSYRYSPANELAIDLGGLINAVAKRMDSGAQPSHLHPRLHPRLRPRLRLSSLEPTIITPSFVNVLLMNHNVICPHFHLSLQSGSESILRRMNRNYTPAIFAEAVALLRGAFPGAAITTDIIAGLPGESETNFIETMEFCRRIAFYRMHVFPYSMRPGTRAAEFPDQIDPGEKRKRAKRLIALSDELSYDFHCRYIGKDVAILVENITGDCVEGLTDNYIRVQARVQAQDKNTAAAGALSRSAYSFVRITGAAAACMYGEIII